jgi:hypothetical protein
MGERLNVKSVPQYGTGYFRRSARFEKIALGGRLFEAGLALRAGNGVVSNEDAVQPDER